MSKQGLDRRTHQGGSAADDAHSDMFKAVGDVVNADIEDALTVFHDLSLNRRRPLPPHLCLRPRLLTREPHSRSLRASSDWVFFYPSFWRRRFRAACAWSVGRVARLE